ncbi:MAG: carboxylating nicotinate-nucleotide diphosphorylase, partial [Planctomycetota bacterium]|nr:carboxylating nicotinate-nucleotide diphosphorylase [Planctomycetota bacterium]
MFLPDLTDAERASAEHLVDLALTEDLGARGDVTTEALVAESERGVVDVVARETGTIAGGVVLPIVFAKLDGRVRIQFDVPDGGQVVRGVRVARIEGPLRALLTGERTALNFLLRLSGIATQTRQFVDRIAGTRSDIFDTRKTLPGWRLLDKYAVRAGGGKNHRIGLYDQILIKDNHLAGWQASGAGHSIPEAIRRARTAVPGMIVEVEVDTLEQLRTALSAHPDIILLDNMDI